MFLIKKYWLLSIVVFSSVVIVILVRFLPLVLPTTIQEDTKISGVIFNNQVWKGDITIIGDVIAAPFTRVTIEPGTNVTIMSGGDINNFYIASDLKRKGTSFDPYEKDVDVGDIFWDEEEKIRVSFYELIADGTKNKPIFINSGQKPGSRFDINVISFRKGKLNYTYMSNYRMLEVGSDVIVQNSNFYNTNECALCIKNGNPKIYNNHFENNYKYQILVNYGSPEIYRNKFFYGAGNGIKYTGNKFIILKVRENYFDLRGKSAIILESEDLEGYIARNVFNTGSVRLPCHSKVLLVENIIRGMVIFNNLGNCNGEYTLGFNYWDMKDPQDIIKARIVGVDEDFKVKILGVIKNKPKWDYDLEM